MNSMIFESTPAYAHTGCGNLELGGSYICLHIRLQIQVSTVK